MLTLMLILAIMAGIVLILDRRGLITNTVYKAVDWLLAYKARLAVTTAGQRGFMNVNTALDGAITIILVVIVIFKLIPTMEDSADTANITNTTVKSFGDLAGWLIPLLAVIGVIILGIRLFLGKKKSG